jgi:hypothetical protein
MSNLRVTLMAGLILAILLAPAPILAAEAASQGGPAPAAALTPLAAQPLDGLSATRERPLFSPTRRPPPAPPVVAEGPPPPPPPPPPPDVALFGIVMDGESARAVIRANPAANVTRVEIGDDVGGWKVVQIEGRKLVLALDGRLATFVMFAGNHANAAPKPGSMSQVVDKPPQQTQQQQTQQLSADAARTSPQQTAPQPQRHKIRQRN